MWHRVLLQEFLQEQPGGYHCNRLKHPVRPTSPNGISVYPTLPMIPPCWFVNLLVGWFISSIPFCSPHGYPGRLIILGFVGVCMGIEFNLSTLNMGVLVGSTGFTWEPAGSLESIPFMSKIMLDPMNPHHYHSLSRCVSVSCPKRNQMFMSHFHS